MTSNEVLFIFPFNESLIPNEGLSARGVSLRAMWLMFAQKSRPSTVRYMSQSVHLIEFEPSETLISRPIFSMLITKQF